MKLPFTASGQYKVRDAELPEPMLLVGRAKTVMAQGEFWRNAVRQFSSHMKLGEAGETGTQKHAAR